jgi:hypothetical protein
MDNPVISSESRDTDAPEAFTEGEHDEFFHKPHPNPAPKPLQSSTASRKPPEAEIDHS